MLLFSQVELVSTIHLFLAIQLQKNIFYNYIFINLSLRLINTFFNLKVKKKSSSTLIKKFFAKN